jgi:hypothetical protein
VKTWRCSGAVCAHLGGTTDGKRRTAGAKRRGGWGWGRAACKHRQAKVRSAGGRSFLAPAPLQGAAAAAARGRQGHAGTHLGHWAVGVLRLLAAAVDGHPPAAQRGTRQALFREAAATPQALHTTRARHRPAARAPRHWPTDSARAGGQLPASSRPTHSGSNFCVFTEKLKRRK